MNNRRKVLLWNLLVLVALLVLLELVLRLFGFQPGVSTSLMNGIRPGAELINRDGYDIDSGGIHKVSSATRDRICEYIENENLGFRLFEEIGYYRNSLDPNPHRISRDFLKMKLLTVDNEFSSFYRKLLADTALSELDKHYLQYVECPINSDGFRSIPFVNHRTERAKVLLLGDSFTWGHKTRNKTSSFADILASRGYAIYNSGIVGADLPQYYAVARKFAARIRPDVIVVNIYLGNDITEYSREVREMLPLFYSTSQGNLYSCPQGIYFRTYTDAYEHMVKMSAIPETSVLRRFLASTCIGSLVWNSLTESGIIENKLNNYAQSYWDEVVLNSVGYSINARYLDSIKQVSVANNAELIISLIPKMDNLNPTSIEDLIGDFSYHLIDDLQIDDYAPADGHFNESGHLKYANFLDSLLTAESSRNQK